MTAAWLCLIFSALLASEVGGQMIKLGTITKDVGTLAMTRDARKTLDLKDTRRWDLPPRIHAVVANAEESSETLEPANLLSRFFQDF